MNRLLPLLACLLAGCASPPLPEQAGPVTNEWRLIREVIIDEPPDYRSDIYFANIAQLSFGEDQVAVPISHIRMTGGGPELGIRDHRATLVVNCATGAYQLTGSRLVDENRQSVGDPEQLLRSNETIDRTSNQAFAEISTLACNNTPTWPDTTLNPQMQPLDAILAQLNADWSK